MKKKEILNTDYSTFFENMGMMLKAGITPGEAVGLLKDDPSIEEHHLKEVLGSIAGSMEEGNSFAKSIRDTGVFPEYAANMLDAAEQTGRLEETLFHLSDYYRNEEAVSRMLKKTVRYPLSLLIMIGGLLLVMIFMVFPAFRSVYESLTGSIAASSYGYVNTSFIVCAVLLVLILILAGLLLAGLYMWRNGKKEKVRKVLSKSKLFSSIFEGFGLYRFTNCFTMFLASGALQEEAMKDSIEVAETESVTEKLNRCLSDMEGGDSFSKAAYSNELYDSVNNRLLIPAERSGNLENVLQRITEELREKNEENIVKVANTVEPLLTGFLLISVGVMLITLMIPLIGIMNSIG